MSQAGLRRRSRQASFQNGPPQQHQCDCILKCTPRNYFKDRLSLSFSEAGSPVLLRTFCDNGNMLHLPSPNSTATGHMCQLSTRNVAAVMEERSLISPSFVFPHNRPHVASGHHTGRGRVGRRTIEKPSPGCNFPNWFLLRSIQSRRNRPLSAGSHNGKAF